MTNTTTRISFPLKTPIVCTTNGKGLWSESIRTITIRRIELDYIFPTDGELLADDDDLYVTFCVYFTKKDWDIQRHGLIYTDERFIRELRKQMNKMPTFRGIFATRGDAAVDYTEQGQQGSNYVSVAVLLKGKRKADFLRRLAKLSGPGALSGL